ncbi:MAG TPA: hypothetical protein VK437_10715, partial [Steroidobacteraceae bacterium]|nr:hypothetical protein [Steroidobacteraceae bacterium]
RDPMRPPQRETRAADAPREPGPVLSAVFARNGTRSAIFNGKLVRAGSVVGPYTIEAVLEDGVRYRHESLTHELHLARSTTQVKKPAAEPGRETRGVQR